LIHELLGGLQKPEEIN